MIFPILAGIRSRFPDAEISLLNKHGSKAADSPLELARSAGYVDKIRCISKPMLRILSFLSRFPYPGRAFYAEGASRDLRKSICIMSRLKFYLGNDTGSIHMAAAAGLRCIGIYSSHSREGLWTPLGEGHRVLRCSPEPECTGCRKQDCPFGMPARCIAAITVDRVLQEVREMLADTSSSRK